MFAEKNHIMFRINSSTNISLFDISRLNDCAKVAENINTRLMIMKSISFLIKRILLLLFIIFLFGRLLLYKLKIIEAYLKIVVKFFSLINHLIHRKLFFQKSRLSLSPSVSTHQNCCCNNLSFSIMMLSHLY